MPPAVAGSGISLNAATEAPGSRRTSEWHWAPLSPSFVFPEPPKVSPFQSFILGSPEAQRMQEAQLPHSQASSLLFILICESSPLRNGCATPSRRVPLPTYDKQQLLYHCQTPEPPGPTIHFSSLLCRGTHGFSLGSPEATASSKISLLP